VSESYGTPADVVAPDVVAPLRPPMWIATRTARWIGTAAFLCFALTGGGRIVGSDEVTMLDLARALLHGGIAVPVGATLDGPDGRHYTKNAAGQAMLALPVVAAAEVAAARLPLPEPRRVLAVRFLVSFFNGLIAALLLAAFYSTVRALGVRPRPALAATVMLGLTTPIWVYAKSFMAEPLQALGLLLALAGSVRAAAGAGRGPWWAGLGVLVAVSAKLSMLPLALVCLWPLRGARPSAWLAPLVLLALALAGHALYNQARFGTPFETGYGAQATPSAYTTPLLVGLYGLVLSSGKGIAWFAPALWLAPAGWWAMRRAGGPPARMAVSVALVAAIALLLYARFEHWAGDGSFGPRYLVPILPLAFVAVAFALGEAAGLRKVLATALAIAGLAVQLGGVAIYFGAQMREAGDYPYRLPLDDPHFMSESHFNPYHSPIVGHWHMLARNAGEHLGGQFPSLSGGGEVDPRVGVSAQDQQQLLHALDFWWLYAVYAGVSLVPVFAVFVALLFATGWCALQMLAAVADEGRAR
jgi:hypothetical protein